MKWIITQINAVPSPVRHFVFGLVGTLALVVANTFVGVSSVSDLHVAETGLGVSLIAASARYILKEETKA